MKIIKVAHILGYFFRGEKYIVILAKNGLGYILGDFLQTFLVTLSTILGKNGDRGFDHSFGRLAAEMQSGGQN
jgi:hypothetical protein